MTNLELEVFRAGDYGAKGAWDDAALEQIAADYNPALHEAPVTLDHAQSGPAHGWVSGLRRAGDKLIATLRGLSSHLRELLTTGSFKKRSIEIYPQLRETGRPYLRAVSFLGAAVPEIKGLADATTLFKENDNAWTAFDEEPMGQAFQPAEDAQSTRNAQIVRDAQFAENTQSAKDVQVGKPAPPVPFSEVAENLKRDGRWQPSWVERGIEKFYDALAQLPAVDIPAQSFSERTISSISPAAWFTEFLAALPPAVILDPLAAPNASADSHSSGKTSGTHSRFAVPIHFMETAPGGPPVAPQSLQLHRAALALQQNNPQLSYSDALLRAAR